MGDNDKDKDKLKPVEGGGSNTEDMVSRSDFNALKSRMDTISQLLEKLIDKTSQPAVPPLIEGPEKAASDKDLPGVKPTDKQDGSSTSGNGADKSYNAVPPSWVHPDPPVNLPHINVKGYPPKLDPTNFAKWKFKMKSYVCSASIK